ncbi:hypothetical protein SDC9_211865 [bioreactor metagenome]|uniref:Uncharacterized protein n=1 Tax=bioreactor metagenome TaxID=1076179 RepID=A0A645JWS8_9ZZZZ
MVAVAEGVAVERDVAQHPAAVEVDEQVSAPGLLAAAARRRVFAGRAQRRAAEIVRQMPAEPPFETGVGMRAEIAQRAAPVQDQVVIEIAGQRCVVELAQTLVDELEHRLVVQLIVPAAKAADADQVVPGVLDLVT